VAGARVGEDDGMGKFVGPEEDDVQTSPPNPRSDFGEGEPEGLGTTFIDLAWSKTAPGKQPGPPIADGPDPSRRTPSPKSERG
jgi:hypothetical protein